MHEVFHRVKALENEFHQLFVGGNLKFRYLAAVSYTHLDVYKRQASTISSVCPYIEAYAITTPFSLSPLLRRS